MNRIFILCALFIGACGGPAVSPANTAPTNTSNADPANTASSSTALEQKLKAIAEQARGEVGVAAVVLETGESAGLNSGGRYPMQSVYKLPIGMAVMEKLRTGELKLDQKVRVDKSEYISDQQHSPLRDKNPKGAEVTVQELLRLAVSESDGTASDVLMRLAGGAPAIQSYLATLGIKDIIVADTEMAIGKDWETQYRNYATPDASVALLRSHAEKLKSRNDRYDQLLQKYMVESPTGAARLKALLRKALHIAHKTGTGGTRDGVASATNDIGIIPFLDGRRMAIAVYIKDSHADFEIRERVIAEIAEAIWVEFSRAGLEKPGNKNQ